MTAAFRGAVAVLIVAAARPAPAAEGVDFARDVAPILEARCVRCHDPAERKGELSLATADDLVAFGYVVPGDVGGSHLLDVVRPSDDGPPTMPKESAPLSEEEVATLTAWVEAGAVWPAGVVVEERAATDKSFWSLRPLADPEPPAPEGLPEAWTANPIDRFVFAQLREAGLEPNPSADRRTLVRRATYDLTGLPPTPEEVEAFVADPSPDAYERLIDRLLDSPRYGERWGRHWLDVARFGESNGYERNVLIDGLWPYRDYVIRSFNEDKPFDRFVLEQLAGDVLGPGDPSVEVGTSFLVCGPYDDVGNQDAAAAAVIRANTIDDMIRATSEAFLGLTVGCARCHDHKFDPITQADYYRFYAAFAGVRHGAREIASPEQRGERDAALAPLLAGRGELEARRAEFVAAIAARAEAHAAEREAGWTRPPADRGGVEERFGATEAKFVRLVVAGTDRSPATPSNFRIDEFEVYSAGPDPRNVALASAGARATGASRRADDFQDAYAAALAIDGRSSTRWHAQEPILTVELAAPATIDRVVFSADRERQRPSEPFAAEYRIEVSADGEQWTAVADSSDRKPLGDDHRRHRLFEAEITPDERSRIAEFDAELAEVGRQIAAVPTFPSWWVGTFSLPKDRDVRVFLGGDPQRPGDPVAPSSPAVLSEVTTGYQLDADAPEPDRRLALARWIVRDDNPLTPRVLANRLWHYHFGTGLVATPSDFGDMGARPSHPALLDWLAARLRADRWRLKPLHRRIMLSQTYRQSSEWRSEPAAADSGDRLLWRFPPRRLDAEEVRDTVLTVSGKLDLRAGGPGFRLYRYLQDNVSTYVPLDEHGPETYRRAVYHQNARAASVDLLAEFDCPDNAFAVSNRSSTTTPLQALTLLNHRFTLDMSGCLAARLEREAGVEPAAQVDRAFALCFGRRPDDAERGAAVTLVVDHGLPAFCRAMLNSTELLHID
ncbi:DUF1553 domain-containing protein [Alienimonas californiensis]|uniref:F5/8 type C domain protein n=1 Tax=Alienimonas californiensis TaxID=2527989 RepID=A0A517P4K8_9PLAN|nr:DUF1553 domain-containing protein [Alienimonas californiensis]QDT14286.1 F5/8 type C domain protein [Alienimonas californiensis]